MFVADPFACPSGTVPVEVNSGDCGCGCGGAGGAYCPKDGQICPLRCFLVGAAVALLTALVLR